MNGIIKCAIIPKKNGVMEIPRTENANSLSTKETFEAYYNKHKSDWLNDLKQVAQDAKDTIMGQTVKLEVEVKKDTTLSSYLSGLAVLDGMDAEKTAGMSYTEAKIGSIFEGNKITTSQGTTNVAKNLNQSNIEYFENLFTNMNTVYIHLQNLLFIVVGGFFLATLGGGKIQKYLENRGQSTGNKEPYLHKFFIPLLCAGVFYMPITSGGGVNSTMIQKIIQYFTAEANHIADVASSVGSSTYVQKMIADIGLKGFVTEDNKLLGELDELKAKFIIEKATEQLKKCTDYYDTKDDFNFAQYDALKWEEFAAKEQLQGGGDKKDGFFANMWSKFKEMFKENKQNISLQACTQLRQEIQNAQKTKEKIEQARKELEEKQGADSESVKVKNRAKETITNTQEMIQTNESLYGWLNSLIVPASVLMLEAQAGYKVAMEQSPDDLKEELDKQTELVAGKAGTESITKDLGHQIAVAVTPYLTTLMLPGANSLRGMIDKLGEHKKREGDSEVTETNHLVRVPLVSAACGYMFYKEFRETSTWSLSDVAIGLLKTMICGKTAWSSGEESAISKIGSIMITHALYKDILTYLPIIIVSVAGILAFLSYFVTLCKYYYISPFVVAFALTTKRVDKIINFLITGITIFFKPVLIVLFIYLALFLHHILQDLFIVTSITQFSVLESSSGLLNDSAIDFTASFATGAIKMLLLFFGSLASCYIVWKTIMTGPDWTFKLLGLDKDSDNTIVSSLSNKMETKAVLLWYKLFI